MRLRGCAPRTRPDEVFPASRAPGADARPPSGSRGIRRLSLIVLRGFPPASDVPCRSGVFWCQPDTLCLPSPRDSSLAAFLRKTVIIPRRQTATIDGPQSFFFPPAPSGTLALTWANQFRPFSICCTVLAIERPCGSVCSPSRQSFPEILFNLLRDRQELPVRTPHQNYCPWARQPSINDGVLFHDPARPISQNKRKKKKTKP